MGNLSELSSFIGIQVDVVDPQTGVGQAGRGDSSGGADMTLGEWAELDINLDIVVLQSNKWESQTDVSVEPELKWNGKGGSRNRTGFGGQSGGVTDHDIVSVFKTRSLSQFIPDVQPLTVVSINGLSTNANRDIINDGSTNVVNPGLSSGSGKGWEVENKVDFPDQVSVTGDRGSNRVTEIWVTAIESLLNTFNSKVSVSSVHKFEEGNTWSAGEIHVLRTILYTPSHDVFNLGSRLYLKENARKRFPH